MSDQQVVVFVGGDLMFFSKVSSAASHAGFRCAMMKNVELLSQKFKSEEIAWIIIDLFQLTPDKIGGLVETVRAASGSARVIGFGPHVDGDNLDAAAQAGLDAVMTRGQLHRSLPEMFLVANG